MATTEIEVYKVPAGIIDLASVSTLLIEQMKEVKGNPAAIPQAAAMSDIAGRICEIAKAQVQQGNMVTDMLRLKQANDA